MENKNPFIVITPWQKRFTNENFTLMKQKRKLNDALRMTNHEMVWKNYVIKFRSKLHHWRKSERSRNIWVYRSVRNTNLVKSAVLKLQKKFQSTCNKEIFSLLGCCQGNSIKSFRLIQKLTAVHFINRTDFFMLNNLFNSLKRGILTRDKYI